LGETVKTEVLEWGMKPFSLTKDKRVPKEKRLTECEKQRTLEKSDFQEKRDASVNFRIGKVFRLPRGGEAWKRRRSLVARSSGERCGRAEPTREK